MRRNLMVKLFFVGVLLVFQGVICSAQLSEGGTPPGIKFSSPKLIQSVGLPAINVDSLLKEDAVNEQYKDRPFRFGYNHFVHYNFNNTGIWTTLPNGDRLWQMAVKAKGAHSINLAFSNFYMPQGARLYVYSTDRQQILGGFGLGNNTADRFFGTELIMGDEVIVEYYEPVAVSGQGSFELFRITQGYKSIKNYLKAFGEAGTCINNINCPQYAAYAVQKRAVVCLVSGGNEFCSGSLVNNTRNDGTPYILTANHCGPADGTWVFRFNWEGPGCPNPAIDPSTAQSISGGVTVAHSTVSDFNLVRMNAVPPASYKVFYLGWSHDTVPATSVTAIHHPSGDIKKCSQAANTVISTTYDAGNGTAQTWRVGQWTDGVTESGSSGSPLLDQNKRVVGQLYGGPSMCNQPDSLQYDFYGKFCVSWDSLLPDSMRLKPWLDPDTTGALINDGYDPTVPVTSFDLAATSLLAPTDSSCYGVISPVITVSNMGTATIRYFTVLYHIDNNADSVYLYNADSLVYSQSAIINLPAIPAAPGSHFLYVSVTQPNDSIDQNLANDSVNGAFKIFVPSVATTPLVQGFEGGAFPPAGWQILSPTSGTTWKSNAAGGYGQSAHSAEVDEYSPMSSTVGETPGLLTPFLDFLSLTPPVYLFFDVANARFNSTNYDSLVVLVTGACGAPWTRIYAKGGTSLATAPDYQLNFVPTSSQWRTDTVRIDSFAGMHQLQFNFQLISGWGNITYIDNINIGDSAEFAIAGIRDVADNFSLKVFPNPSTGNFTLDLNASEKMILSAELYAIDGRLMQTIASSETLVPGRYRYQINGENLSDGIYLLRLNNRYLKLEKTR